MIIALLIRLLILFILVQILLFKVLLLALSFLTLAFHFYIQTNNLGLIVFAILLLFVTGVIILSLWIRSLIVENNRRKHFQQSKSKAYILISFILIIVFSNEWVTQKWITQEEAFSYLLESNYLGSIFALFLLLLLLLSRMYLKLSYKSRSR